jgi:hypothetical protein
MGDLNKEHAVSESESSRRQAGLPDDLRLELVCERVAGIFYIDNNAIYLFEK